MVKLAKSLNKNGCLKGRAMGMARDLHRLYQVMASATDDRELEQRLAHLKDILEPGLAADETPPPTIVAAALNDIISFTDTAAREIAQDGRAARKKTAIDVIDL